MRTFANFYKVPATIFLGAPSVEFSSVLKYKSSGDTVSYS